MLKTVACTCESWNIIRVIRTSLQPKFKAKSKTCDYFDVTNCDNYYAVSARHCFDTYKMKKSGSTTGLAKIGVRFGGLPNILTGLFDNQKNNLSKSKSCSSPNLFTSRPDREINDEHNRMFKRAKSAFEETRRIFQQNDEKSLSKPQKTEGKKTTKPHPTGHVST